MFFPKPKTRPIYLYQDPFVIRTPEVDMLHAYKYFDDEDKTEREKINAILITFAKNNKLIEMAPEPRFIGNNDGGSWRHHIQFLNFCTLQNPDGQMKVISSIQNQGTITPIAVLLECHVRLGMTCDELTLSKMITRTYHALGNIPTAERDEVADEILTDLHIRYPMLWLMPALQALLYNHVPMVNDV